MKTYIHLICLCTVLLFGTLAQAQVQCSRIYTETRKEASSVGQTIASENTTELINKYFYAEFFAPKAVEVKPGASLAEVRAVPVERHNTERLNIEKVMEAFSLSRFQAVEVQALLRLHSRSPNDAQFLAAIKAVQSGQTVSKLDQDKIRKAPFTLVLDIDGTLLDQDSNSVWIPNVHEKSFLVEGKKINHVALNPGAMVLIKKAKSMGAAIVLYSRNSDLLIHEILESFRFEGASLAETFDGILTSSHMVMPPAMTHMIGKTSTNRLVRKDLRLIESERIVLVDDNPDYVLQKQQLRVVSEFSLNSALGKADGVRQHLERMNQQYQEIGYELDFLAQNPSRFQQLQVVFSPLGREALALLTQQPSPWTAWFRRPLSPREALIHLLNNPHKVYEILKAQK